MHSEAHGKGLFLITEVFNTFLNIPIHRISKTQIIKELYLFDDLLRSICYHRMDEILQSVYCGYFLMK